MHKTSKHQKELWGRFTKSGSVYDYLAYRGCVIDSSIQATYEFQTANEILATETAVKNSDQSRIP